jgi:hypothetical protein
MTDSDNSLNAVMNSIAQPTGLRLVWAFWKAYVENVGFYETLVVLTAIYALVVAPISLLARLFRHRFLPVRPRDAATFWYETRMGTATALKDLGKQG